MTYKEGFRDGWNACAENYAPAWESQRDMDRERGRFDEALSSSKPKKKRPLSDWNRFVKANSKKPRFVYQSGKKKGKLNLKKMGVAYRKTPAGRKR